MPSNPSVRLFITPDNLNTNIIKGAIMADPRISPNFILLNPVVNSLKIPPILLIIGVSVFSTLCHIVYKKVKIEL